ncbi:MAG TPA: hypothetical protein VK507_23510 [Iamia sp.]|nr:hypothetical protein [Iamia sp.]
MTDPLDPRWRDALRRHADAEPTPEAWAVITDRAADDDVGSDPAATPPGRRRWVLATAAAIVVLVGLAALAVTTGSGDEPVDAGPAADEDETTTTTVGPDGLPAEAQVWGRVLEDADHGPELCRETGDLSAHVGPPTCRGIPLVDWDWADVDDDHVDGEARWGEYHVVGIYDGETIRVTEPPGPPDGRPAAPLDPGPERYRPPCPEPPGGWAVIDPERAGIDDREALQFAARKQPDLGLVWVDESIPVAGGVMTVTFTGDLERHRTELAAVWGGALCVAEVPHSAAELRAAEDVVLQAANADTPLHAGDLSIPVTGVMREDIEQSLLVYATWAPPGAEEALTELLGFPVTVSPEIHPVD